MKDLIDQNYPTATPCEKENILDFHEKWGTEINCTKITLEDFRRYEKLCAEFLEERNHPLPILFEEFEYYVKEMFLAQQKEINKIRKQKEFLLSGQNELFNK